MGNLGGGEILVILVVALLVLGPTRLPTAARQVGNAIGELRRLSSGFQNEMKAAMDDISVESSSSDSATGDITDAAGVADGEDERRARGRRLVTGSSDSTDAESDATDTDTEGPSDEDLGRRNGFDADPVETPESAGDDVPG